MGKTKSFALLGFLTLYIYSCTIDGTNWDVNATAPVVETRLDLTNLIGDENLAIGTDSSVNIAIDVPLYTFNFDTLENLPLAKSVFAYIWTFPTVNLSAGAGIPGLESSLDLDNNGIKLSDFDIKKGKLRCTLKHTINQPLIFRYYIPKMTKNGVMFEFKDTLPGVTTPGDTVVEIKEIAVDDFKIDLSGNNGDDFNTLKAYTDVQTIVGGPTFSLVNGSTIFKTESELVELTPNYARGYFGQYYVNQTNSVTTIEQMQMIQGGLVDVENMNLKLTFHNTIGADVSFHPITIAATNTRTSQTVNLNHPTIGTTVNINRATENPSVLNPVTASQYSFTITSGNSNIENFIELLPDQFALSADVALNPFGNTGAYSDFFYFDFPAYIQMQLNMPLKLQATDLLLVDTIDNPFTGIDILDPITDGEFIVRVENKFPLSSDLQLYLMDGTHTVTDSLFANTLVAAAPVDINDRVIQPLTTELSITVDANKIQLLKNASFIKFRAKFNSEPSSSGRIQFYSDYYMIIKMIADVKFNIAL
jgi:hypothetical protein